MGKVRSPATVALFFCAVSLVGCDKEFELTFVNLTPETLDLHVAVPGEGWEHVGPVEASGGKREHEVEIDDDLLPATCRYQAGPHRGRFTLTKDMAEKQWIDIRRTGQ